MISQDASARIELLRFPMIVGIVFLHSYGSQIVLFNGPVGAPAIAAPALFFHNLVSQVLARTVVPLFFLISGLLAFNDAAPANWLSVEKLRRRVRTLLVPYLIWSTATLAFLFAVQSIPGLRVFFSGRNKFIADYTVVDFINAYWGPDGFPLAYQFWFIRDLMILVVLWPLFGLIARRLPWFGLWLAMLAWLTGMRINGVPLSTEAVLFFYLGVLVAKSPHILERAEALGKQALWVYPFLALLDAALRPTGFVYYSVIHRLIILPGIVAVWHLAGRLAAGPWKERLIGLAGLSFFVYAAHEPLLGSLKKVAYMLFAPSNSLEVTAVYLVVPMVVVTATSLAGHGIKFLVPGFYRAITGGR